MQRPGPEHFRKLERMYASAPINAFFRPVLTVGEGTAELVMPVREEFFHAAHAMHGAVYFKALDDAAFFAANSLVTDAFVLTVSYTVHLTRPVTGGSVRASARVVHHSRSLLLADAELFDQEGRQVARGTGSFMPSRTPLSEEIGYR
jgi:uncharacterized protein (TIGR00369 family)